MKDICTFETAVKLKDAGFPQPQPEAGQVWYARDETFIFLGKISSGAWTVCSVDYDEIQNIYPNDVVFAPTATDILRELPGFDLGFYTAGPIFDGFGPSWCIEDIDGYVNEEYYSTNPVEACAAAWLDLNKTDK